MGRGLTEDLSALQLSLNLMLASGNARRVEQIEWKLRQDGWRQTAEFCAYYWQTDNLKLHPAQSPPCWLTAEEADAILAKGPRLHGSIDVSNCPGARLFKRMQAFGISKYHPDPIGALQEAEAARGKAA